MWLKILLFVFSIAAAAQEYEEIERDEGKALPRPDAMANNFNSFGAWKQQINDKFDWTIRSSCTPSSSTGPCTGHGGSGSYAYIETSSPRVQGDSARLNFKASNSDNLCMTFYYHMYGNTMGTLNVFNDNKKVFSRSGDLGNAWHVANIDLDARDLDIVIEGITGSSYTGDIAIDDISVSRRRCNAPTPTPGNTVPPPTGGCGTRPVTSRIVGGTQAPVNSWPWQAMLTTSSGGQFCGGSLVHPLFVVTASHCVERQTASSMKIRMGAHYRVSGNVGTEQDIPVAQIITHPQYHSPLRYSNDIAVIRLARPAVLGRGVSTVCMPRDDLPLPLDDPGKKCYITGWGTLASGGSQPNHLMQASVPLVSKARCLKGYPGKIHDSMLCAGLDQGGVDACQGDSGGPLVCEYNGRWYLEGATSWGYGCAAPMKYGVYALVRYNRAWVHSIMGLPISSPPPGTPPLPTNPPSMNTNFNTLGSWKQATNDKFDWTLLSGNTPSSATGPSSDHSGSGMYAYIETSSPRVQGDNARLTFSGSSNGPLCMTFYYHMYGSSIGSLKVYDEGVVVLTLTGNNGNVWVKEQVDLRSDRNVIIEGVRGSSYTGDIAIDDISVNRGRCASTAPPTPPPPGTPPLPSPIPGQCGVSSVTRVIAGIDAQPGAWPWQIGLHRNGGFICGGSLIKRDWVVTAAHCVTYNNPSAYFVRLGDHNRNVQEGTEQDIKVVRIISHPNYNNPTLSSDIALLQLEKQATLNSRVGLACLPAQDYDLPAGSNCYITGWGKIRHPGSSHHILQQAHMPSIDHAECKRKNNQPGITVTDVMLCGGKANTQISGCHGDSGGPYVCRNSAGRWVLQGDVSWGNPQCDSTQRYTVFGRVAKFRNWIDMHTLGGTQPPPPPPPPPTQPPTPRPPTQPPSQSMNTNFNTLGSWKQATNDKFDWTLQSGGTSSSATGPSSDHSGSGKYAYIETSSPRVQGDNARLTFSGSSNGPLCMTFYYHMYGSSIGSLKVYDDGVVVLTLTGNKGNAWVKQQVDLRSDRNVIIEGVRGSSYTGDIAIDDISVTRGRCAAPPTPPPPGTPPLPSQTPNLSCGTRPVTSRIVGGTQAPVNSWPWQAMLTSSSGRQFCGGSLIHPQFVVTASHCVVGKSPSSMKIRMGAHYRVSGNVGTEQDIPVAQIITHPQYHSPLRYSNDIAVIRLARPAVLGRGVSTVCMPRNDLPLPLDDPGRKCYITGWGTLASGGSQPNHLMQASVPLVSKARCLKGYPGKIHDSMLCAGLDQGGVDACQGDSGGPLVCEYNGRWYLEGATSWGYGCAAPMKYGVYALVRYNRVWVKSITGV